MVTNTVEISAAIHFFTNTINFVASVTAMVDLKISLYGIVFGCEPVAKTIVMVQQQVVNSNP